MEKARGDECIWFTEELAQGYRYHYTQTKAVSQALVKAVPWGFMFYNCNPYMYMIQIYRIELMMTFSKILFIFFIGFTGYTVQFSGAGFHFWLYWIKGSSSQHFWAVLWTQRSLPGKLWSNSRLWAEISHWVQPECIRSCYITSTSRQYQN